jgi:predicted O-methyltransferase YrrM
MAEMGNARLFNDAMFSMTSALLPGLLSAYDFSRVGKLMDVGGGYGQLLIAILKKYPSMSGMVYDLPHCAEGARKNFADAGVADRAEFVGGSFFDSIPSGAETIVMKSILHDWNDERCLRILQHCHRALNPGARLIVIDRIMPEKLEPAAAHLSVALSDLNMLRGPGGCERTEREHRALLADGGFRMTRCVPAGRIDVIEATVA